jgi:hypothetical protein
MKLYDVSVTAVLAALATFGYGCSATVTANTNIAPPSGCSTNGALACEGGGDGWTCSAGDNPEAEQSGLSCSVPQADGANDDFCCISWTSSSSTCTPDDGLTAECQYPSYGYQCEFGDNPVTLDSSLNCSTPSADPDGEHDDFCCQ